MSYSFQLDNPEEAKHAPHWLNAQYEPKMEELTDVNDLMYFFQEMKASSGPTPGPDGIRLQTISNREMAGILREKVESITSGQYRHGPVRAVTIPKPSGGTRTLNISNVADRILGKCLSERFMSYFETCRFQEQHRAFAYRRSTSRELMIAKLINAIEPGKSQTILSLDIKQAFDHVQPFSFILSLLLSYKKTDV
jgi:RNA-directed DNA polymerase